MKSTRQKFTYTKPTPFINWGCHFDSLTELKFVISIWEEYDFMRSPVSIYYHPGTLQPINSIRLFHRRYTPDFLIRHKITGDAFITEIKPRSFQLQHELVIRRQVVENYIRRHHYDWKFKIVFDDEIILNSQQLADFEDCLQQKNKSSFNQWAFEYSAKLTACSPNPLSKYPLHKQAEYIMLGRIISLHSWNKQNQ